MRKKRETKMAKQPEVKKKRSVNRKAVSAAVLVVALALTVVFIILGVTGRNMDAQGLYRLLPWLPVPGGSAAWQEALVPGAGLGDTVVQTFTPVQSGEAPAQEAPAQDAPAQDASAQEAPTQDALEEAVRVTAKRLNDLGWTDTAVEVSPEGNLVVTLPKGADTGFLGSLLGSRGEFTFADPQGEVFLNGSHVTSAGFGYADQSGTNFALSIQFDAEGKRVFAEKSTELLGQSIMLLRDGVTLSNPSISTPLTDGAVSIPGFTLETARENAILLRSGALPFEVTLQGAGEPGAALHGERAQRSLIIALTVLFALAAVCLIVCFRLAGLAAAWMLLAQLALSYFFSALIGAGFTVLTLSAIWLSWLVSVFAMANLLLGMREDVLHGRSVRQALKESYAGRGHASLDVYVGLAIIAVLLIIVDGGVIKLFSEIFAICLLLGLAVTHLALRLVTYEAINLFGGKSELYAAKRTLKKEG